MTFRLRLIPLPLGLGSRLEEATTLINLASFETFYSQ